MRRSLAILGMAGCAATGDLVALSALHLLTGSGGALAASAAHGARGGLLLGLFHAGPGFGIAVFGVGMPAWFAKGGGWQGAWLLLAALALALLGWGARGGGASGVSVSAPLLAMGPTLLAYAMCCFGYIGCMTFVFVWVRDAWGEGTGQARFWMLIGAGGMAAPWLWAGLWERAAPMRGFSVLTALRGSGAALPLAGGAAGWIIASAVLLGACFFAVVASTTRSYAVVQTGLRGRAAWRP